MRWLGVLMVVLAFPAPGEAAVSCGSGAPQYEQDGVRVFETRDRHEVPTWWACSARVRKPVRVAVLSPGVDNTLHVQGRDGHRLVFAIESFADGGGGWEAGWFDVRSGGVAVGFVDTASRRDFTGAPTGIDVNARGDLAYVLDQTDADGEETLRSVVHRPYDGGRRFGKERVLARLGRAQVEPRTIRLGADEVTFNEEGATRSVKVSGSSSRTAGGRAVSPSRCRAGTTVYHDGARLFRTGAGLFVCTAGRQPRLTRVSPSRRARPSAYDEDDRTLAFLLGDRIFRLHLRTGLLRSGRVPAGPDGTRPKPLVVRTGTAGAAAITGTGSVVLLPARVGDVVELAPAGPEALHPPSLAFDDAERTLTWRLLGAPRRAALSAGG